MTSPTAVARPDISPEFRARAATAPPGVPPYPGPRAIIDGSEAVANVDAAISEGRSPASAAGVNLVAGRVSNFTAAPQEVSA